VLRNLTALRSHMSGATVPVPLELKRAVDIWTRLVSVSLVSDTAAVPD